MAPPPAWVPWVWGMIAGGLLGLLVGFAFGAWYGRGGRVYLIKWTGHSQEGSDGSTF